MEHDPNVLEYYDQPSCFKIQYTNKSGRKIGHYHTPDFFVRTQDGAIWLVETKGREELDLPQKLARLRQWCEDATTASLGESALVYRFLYVDQEGFESYKPASFSALAASFTEFQKAPG